LGKPSRAYISGDIDLSSGGPDGTVSLDAQGIRDRLSVAPGGVTENEKEYRVLAELPGVKKEEIGITINGNEVAVSVEVKHE
jgi:HSP20 family molecular chaperone IbpA